MRVAIDCYRTEPQRRDLKYWRFQLPERWNVDHLRLALVNGQGSTLAERGSKRIVILQPFPTWTSTSTRFNRVLGRRRVIMCTLVIRDVGLGISKGQLAAYDKRVVVFFQKCA